MSAVQAASSAAAPLDLGALAANDFANWRMFDYARPSWPPAVAALPFGMRSALGSVSGSEHGAGLFRRTWVSAPAPRGGPGGRPLPPLQPGSSGLISLVRTAFEWARTAFAWLLSAFRALFLPPWFFVTVMLFWYGSKYDWAPFSQISATDQVCMIGALLLALFGTFANMMKASHAA